MDKSDANFALVMSKSGLQLLTVVISSLLFSVVIVYTQITNWAEVASDTNLALQNNLKTDASATIGIVRTLQGILAATSSIALVRSFTYLHWGLMRRQQGLSYLSLMALAPATLDWGTLQIIFSSSSRLSSRSWALLNVLLTSLLWVSGLILFCSTVNERIPDLVRTSIVVVYDTAHSYDVTAGVGPFNSSYLNDFLGLLQNSSIGYEHQVLPYTYYGVVYNLVTNPIFSTLVDPIRCDKSTNCASYLLSGGILMTAPWQPTGWASHPLIKVPRVQTVQLEFHGGQVTRSFADSDCDNFGDEGVRIAVRLCLANHPTDPWSFDAGLFVCKDGLQDGACSAQSPAPNITTTMSFFSRQATVVASRFNSSIVSVSNMTSAQYVHMGGADLSAYRVALRWLLDFRAANIPAPSSIVENFWTSSEQLRSDSESYGYLQQHFHSILAFPLWLFNANNFGNIELRSNAIVSTLPPQFYTMAHVVAPYTKVRFNQAMIIVFAALQGVVLLFAWVVLLWAMWITQSLPMLSSFPLFDIAFKADVQIPERQSDIWLADDKEIKEYVKHSTVRIKRK